MRFILMTTLLMATTLAAPPATAGPAADALTVCLADSTSGKDRKELARWVFVAMSAHPEISLLARISDETRIDAHRKMAALVTRLITEDCVAQARTAIKAEGSTAFGTAFKSLGELAMQEVMNNPSVNASIGEYLKYLDQQRLQMVLGGK